ncbi:sulfur carrier protein ThiS [Limibaculum sp. M0105]|uniref:Sulfur carrier protein ThiS n=1 Tax=Thermohalobaculum xanthum TaxID=2753746 RepID=A0A8J7MA00_9RHOB|nr:sulfur carrier protein ThiS [Thermohalobaculum xanthum]MBK0400327.1 sulfur carrier protein ThiS [Thermohalobaculum xanthum]
MTIILNGEPREIAARALDAALAELGYGGAHVATAVNGDFVPRGARAGVELNDGDRLEVLAPLQGG